MRLDGDGEIKRLTRIDSSSQNRMGRVGKYDARQNTYTPASWWKHHAVIARL